ncbi:Slp family lipoprotein [Celerinatantimonas yamalensis]|uniref:Slp family lipoprotein n=1 Tax=Celerinatantimonas yamalensis TaxID=559956 RepID=A0ABW9G4P8_9GAMM
MLKWQVTGLALTMLVLTGCSSLPKSVQLASNQQNIAYQKAFLPTALKHTVLWQGQIAQITNTDQKTRLQIVYQQLDYQGNVVNDNSAGRFVAIIPQFLDPMIYRPGRSISVKGVIDRPMGISVGQSHQKVPVIEVKQFYLWPIVKDKPPEHPFRVFASDCFYP